MNEVMGNVNWVRKAQPSPSDVHIDAALTNISVAYVQNSANFVADRVFPVVPVEHQTNKYFLWDRANFYRNSMEKRAPSTESAGGGMALSTDSYSCDVWALHKDIDNQTRANSDPAVDPDIAASEFLSQQNLINRDIQWATNYFGTGIWTTDVVGGTDFTAWDDYSSDPEKDVDTGKLTMLQNTGYMPNTLVVGYKVHQALKRHPLIKDRYKHVSSESITEEMIARFFEIENYVVAKATKATANEGAASQTYALILGTNALLCYANPSPGLMVPSAGYTFVWSRLTGLNNMGVTIASWWIQNIKADRLEIEASWTFKKVAADLGYFFSAATS